MRKSLKSLFKNLNFMMMTMAYCFILMIIYTVSANVAPLISPFGFGSIMSAYIGICFIATGLIGAMVYGFLLGYSRKFKMCFLIITFGSV